MKNMENDEKETEPRKVAKATRDAIVGAADRVNVLKEKTSELGREVQRKWDQSKPRRQEVKDTIKDTLNKTAERVSSFGGEVKAGLKEGIAEIRERNKTTT